MEVLPKNDRIKYIPLYQSKDRMKEYNRIRPELEDLVSFNGQGWDWDVLVTVRSTQTAMLRVLCGSPRSEARMWSKRIILIEDMMILSEKPTVAQSACDVQDRLTVEGYLAADTVLIPAYHEKKWVMNSAKKHFSPSVLRDMDRKIREVCHLNMPKYELKTKHRFKGGRKMGVAFVGRMERMAARLTSINEILSKQFIMHGNEVHPFICTISDSTKGVDESAVEIRRPNREEFHRIAKEEMDVAVYFFVDVELSMSMLEPVSMGVPAIVVDAPWSRAALGDDYPFYAKGETQAYAMVNMFRENYDAQYVKFAKWFKAWFIPTYDLRVKNDGLYKHLVEEIQYQYPDAEENLQTLKKNSIVKLLVEKGGQEFRMLDLIKSMKGTELDSLAAKVQDNDREKRNLVFSTPWNEFRLALKQFYGYEDASTDLGHLRKVK